MRNTVSRTAGWVTTIAAATLIAACNADHTPVAPTLAVSDAAQLDLSSPEQANRYGRSAEQQLTETLRRVTARYHDIEIAKRDSFVLLHDCETRLNDEPVGTVYVNMSRLTDGVINPEQARRVDLRTDGEGTDAGRRRVRDSVFALDETAAAQAPRHDVPARGRVRSLCPPRVGVAQESERAIRGDESQSDVLADVSEPRSRGYDQCMTRPDFAVSAR